MYYIHIMALFFKEYYVAYSQLSCRFLQRLGNTAFEYWNS